MIALRVEANLSKMAGIGEKAALAISRGLNKAGDVTRTTVRRELSNTTGLKYSRVVEATEYNLSSPGNLRYEIIGKGYQNDARYLKVKPKYRVTSKGEVIYRNMGAGDAHHKFVVGARGSLTAALWATRTWDRALPSDKPGGARVKRQSSKKYGQIYAANIAKEIAGTNPKTGAKIQNVFRVQADLVVPRYVLWELQRALG